MLLNDMEMAHFELRAAAVRAIVSVKTYKGFSKNMYIVNWPESNQRLLELHLWEWNQWIVNDCLDSVRSSVFNDIGESKGGNHVLLKRHPVLCGMMLFRLKLNKQEAGMSLCTAWGSLPISMHLYNACLAEGILQQPWSVSLEKLNRSIPIPAL
jgi:hypothetical protein